MCLPNFSFYRLLSNKLKIICIFTVIVAPAASPKIQQKPAGSIIKGNNVTLTCLVSGGKPLATLSWNCSGTYINNTSGNTTSLSVYIRVEKSDNNKICTCSATHLVTSYRRIIHHTLTVHCKYCHFLSYKLCITESL